MNGGKEKVAGVIGPALAGLAVLLAAAIAINLVQLVAITTPHVGDIIAFDTRYPVPSKVDARLLVHRPDQFACVLDVDVIRQNGGSVIVEARIPGESRAYYLHWAGIRTSADTSDCGRAADLIVDHHDLDVLALGAGGYGTGYKPVQVSAYSQGY